MLTAEDRLQIIDVIARYNRAADDRDVEATVALYADDGVIEGDMATTAGHEGLREGLPPLFEMEGTLKRHISANHIFEGDGMRATVRSMLIVFEGETLPGVAATADIEDELRKVEGRWLMSRHRVKIDPAMFAAMQAQQDEAG